MTRTATVKLPEDLMRRAEDYAARHGTSVAALVRGHLERVTSEGGASPETPEPLRAFAEGRLSKEQAIQQLGLRDHAQLLLSLGDHGLQPPSLPAHDLATMQRSFVRLLKDARGDGALYPRRP
jgi:hypothetical protein